MSDTWFFSPTITVHEEDNGPKPTGILNAQGHMMYRQAEKVPMGFHHSPQVAKTPKRQKTR